MSYEQNRNGSEDNITPATGYDGNTDMTGSGLEPGAAYDTTNAGNYGKSEMFDTQRQGQARRSDVTDTSYGDSGTTGYGGTSAGMRSSSLGDDEGDNRAFDTKTGGYPPGRGTGTTHPTMGDKVKGQMEKMAGKIMDDSGMVERGQERKTGTGPGSTY